MSGPATNTETRSVSPNGAAAAAKSEGYSTFYVPGRVCLFGDKIDLLGLPIIAATVDRSLRLDIRKTPQSGGVVKFFSDNFGSGVEFELDKVGDKTGAWWQHPLKYWCGVTLRLKDRIGAFEARLVSDIPIGKGMASSGAVSVGLAKALNETFNLGMSADDIANVAYLAEHDDLAIPCGRMDQYAIAHGGVTHVWTGDDPRVAVVNVPERCRPLAIVVGDTLEPRPLKKLLEMFRAKLAEHDPLVEDVFARIAECVEGGRKALEAGDLELVGDFMRAQMTQERRVGCITVGLEKLCGAAEKAGAYGAKLTGIGGGGCMVALCRPGKQKDVADAIVAVGGKAWIVNVVSYEADGSFHNQTPRPETL